MSNQLRGGWVAGQYVRYHHLNGTSPVSHMSVKFACALVLSAAWALHFILLFLSLSTLILRNYTRLPRRCVK